MECNSDEINNPTDENVKYLQNESINDRFPDSLCTLPPAVIEQLMATPMLSLSDEYPRVGVTPSMIWAYANMRGATEKQTDPLHQAIYPGADRDLFPRRVNLHSKDWQKSALDLHKGAKFFWDPLKHIKRARPTTTNFNSSQHSSTERKISNLGFDKYMAQFKPTIGRHHPKGANVYANFGYYNENNMWADPDSMYSMDKALQFEPPRSSKPLSPTTAVFTQAHTGPKIMNFEEEDAFYNALVGDLSDGEGDPREHRIGAATFARFASGAKIGDVYVETALDPEIYKPRKRAERSRVPVIPKFPDPQYDIEDEDLGLMSGVYSDISIPSVQEGPRGVNLDRIPNRLSYLMPTLSHAFPLQDYEVHTGLSPLIICSSSSSCSPPLTSTSSPSSPCPCRYHRNSHNPNNQTHPKIKTRSKLTETSTNAYQKPSSHLETIIITDDLAITTLGEETFSIYEEEIYALRHRHEKLRRGNEGRYGVRNYFAQQRDELRKEMIKLRLLVGEDEERERKCPQGRGVPGSPWGLSADRGGGGDEFEIEVGGVKGRSDIGGGGEEGKKVLRRKMGRTERFLEEEKRNLEAGVWREEREGGRIDGEIGEMKGEVQALLERRQRIVNVLEERRAVFDGSYHY